MQLVALKCGHQQGRPPVVVLCVWFGTSVEEQLDNLGVALARRPMQRGELVQVEFIDVCAPLDEHLHHLPHAPVTRVVQTTTIVLVSGLEVGTSVEKQFSDLCVSLSDLWVLCGLSEGDEPHVMAGLQVRQPPVRRPQTHVVESAATHLVSAVDVESGPEVACRFFGGAGADAGALVGVLPDDGFVVGHQPFQHGELAKDGGIRQGVPTTIVSACGVGSPVHEQVEDGPGALGDAAVERGDALILVGVVVEVSPQVQQQPHHLDVHIVNRMVQRPTITLIWRVWADTSRPDPPLGEAIVGRIYSVVKRLSNAVLESQLFWRGDVLRPLCDEVIIGVPYLIQKVLVRPPVANHPRSLALGASA
mmetsp:Transcript_46760/g.116550  ORF Transcript_46760/g.116550 Transcript_46760/m.116550 type:complete len:362 (+) Transcript_46760:1347-2432(+)